MKQILAIHFLLVVAVMLMAGTRLAAAEPMVVKGDRASLSQAFRLARYLPAGTLVNGEVDARDARVVTLSLDGQAYTARRDEFLTVREALDAMSTKRIELDGQLATFDDLFTNRYARINTLGTALLHLQRDSALLFQVEDTTVQVDQQTQPGTGGKPGTTHTTTTVTPTYRYDDVISRGDARRFTHDWNDEINKLQTELDKLWEQRRVALTTRAQLTAADQDLKARVQQFTALGAAAAGRPYLVTAAKIALYRDQKLMVMINQGTAVWGEPHPLVGWLAVSTDTGRYDARTEGLAAAGQVTDDFLATKFRAESAIKRQEEDIRLLKNRQTLYVDLSTNLKVAAKYDRGYLVIRDIDRQLGYTDFYTVANPTRSSVVADRNEARNVLRDWDKDQKALEKDMETRRQAITQAKKDLAAAEARFLAAQAAIAKIHAPLPGAPAAAPAGEAPPPPPAAEVPR